MDTKKFDPDSTMMINLNSSISDGNFRLTFLGSGSAGTVGDGDDDNWQSNLLLEDLNSDRKLLIDAGDDVRKSLWQARKLRTRDITDIYITHPHGDHIHGLEGIAFDTKFIPGRTQTNLIVSKSFASDLWSRSLQLGLESLEGEIADIHSYFKLQTVGSKGRFDWQGIKFQMVQVVHIMNGYGFVPSFGLMFKINGVTVFFTSDTQFAPHQMKKFEDQADLIFQDCETSPFMSGVHAHYSELKGQSPEVKAKKWLYHFQPGPKPDAIADGFKGFVKKGQEFYL